MKIGRITVSDRASAGVYEDRSGPAIEAALGEHFPAAQFAAVVVPDEVEMIAAALLRFTDDFKVDLVVTTGGTGISLSRRHPGSHASRAGKGIARLW